MTIDDMFAAARERIHASIERRLQVVPRSRESINRSCGQLFGKRGRIWKAPPAATPHNRSNAT